MIIVSGCPRSGTSITMLCLSEAVGMDNIIGGKYDASWRHILQQHRLKDMQSKVTKNDTKVMSKKDIRIAKIRKEAKDYIANKLKVKRHSGMPEDRKDLNPTGFWECPFSVRGIVWESGLRNIFKLFTKDRCMKIVSSGLRHTEPRYVDKMIYLLRDPREVAKSQERLSREKYQDKEGRIIDLGKIKDAKIHSPEMYIQSNLTAAQWFLDNPDVPKIIVRYEDLILRADDTLQKIGDFIGKDMSAAKKHINPDLYRSKTTEEIPHPQFEDAYEIYNLFLENKYQEVLDVVRRKESENRKANEHWICTRLKLKTCEAHCLACRENQKFQDSLRKYAAFRNINWRNEPCMFECGITDTFPGEPITIEESIANNFWLDSRFKIS